MTLIIAPPIPRRTQAIRAVNVGSQRIIPIYPAIIAAIPVTVAVICTTTPPTRVAPIPKSEKRSVLDGSVFFSTTHPLKPCGMVK